MSPGRFCRMPGCAIALPSLELEYCEPHRAEMKVVARLRERRMRSVKGGSVRLSIPGPRNRPRERATHNTVDLHALARRGLVDRWELPDCVEWTACDQPASVVRPHWRCEPLEDPDLRPPFQRFAMFVNVGSTKNGEAYVSFYCDGLDPGHAQFVIEEAVEAVSELLRPAPPASPDIADAIAYGLSDRYGIASDVFDNRGKLVPHAPIDARTTPEERQGKGERGVFVKRSPFNTTVRRYAMINSRQVVETIVVATEEPLDPLRLAIPLPENSEYPVCAGWTYRHGVFYSPAKENGLGAGMHQVRAKGDDR